MFAPVVLFTYRRLFKTKKLINSLLNNNECKYTDLFIYSDYPESVEYAFEIDDLKNYLYSISGFKTVTIIERDFNFGLRDNILEGINEILNIYENAIFLEDDLIVSDTFLKYMNHYLSLYSSDSNIFSISGFVPEIFINDKTYNYSTFLSYRLNTWGWATWKSKWKKINLNINNKLIYNHDIISNLYGKDISKSLNPTNILYNKNIWSLKIISLLYHERLLNVYPIHSQIICNGIDTKSIHSNSYIFSRYFSNFKSLNNFDLDIVPYNENLNYKIVSFYNQNRIEKIFFVLKKLIKIFKW